ncbi:g9841 [Coccomyxa viridis]|uniref:G9841 protein n=1 Tax=Coccomyxa viridis TaxID=1274662 RepID=A0ABP1G3S9_9CHLO
MHTLLHLQTFEEATIFNVQCNETDVVVWTAAEQVKLSNLAVFNKSLTVYGYTITLDEVQLVGTNFTVVAPYIDCGGASVVTLNTTGKPAPVSYHPNVTEPITCTGNACQGPAGNSTTIAGGQGGSVTIYASETRNCNNTLIKVITVGGTGGRGEDGGNGVIGETGDVGRTIDCEADCHDHEDRAQCKRDYPLLDYKGPQYDLDWRQMYCAAYYNPQTKSGEGQGHPGKKGGLPGIAGNSTYSGSGGSITLPAGALVTTNFSADSNLGAPLFTLASNRKPGAGGAGGAGGLGEQSFITDFLHHPNCATYGTFNDHCTCPPGPSGPPGCEDSTNSTDSCSKVVAQPQIVTMASRYYFNRQYEDAARAYVFLRDACDSVTFTPLIGLTALETFTGTQLANFKELEAAYSTYWKASTSAADKKAELQNTISKNTQIADGLRKKQADVLVQQQASLAEFNVLASQRSTANETLGRASQAFKDAVNILRNSQPSFLELLSCIASTVVGVGADVAGIGKITGDFEKVLPNYKKTGQALSGYSGASLVIGNVNTELYPAWDKYAKTSNEANEDATKLVTGSQQFNEYLEEYKQLPQAGEYKRDLSILQQVAASTSAKVLQNTAQFQQYQQLELEIVASNANTEDIRGMLAGADPNPAAVEFANYISGSYVRAQQSVLQSVYQINQAYRYAFPGASPDVAISSKDYQGLSTANSELLNKVKTQLTLQGGNSHPVNELPPFMINATEPGFSDLLKPGGRFTFYINSSDPSFYNLAQFYASKVKVTVLGTVTPLDPTNPRLDVNLRHLGTPAVISTSCQEYTFTHNFRDSTYSYNVQDPSKVYSDGYLGGCGSGAPSDGK